MKINGSAWFVRRPRRTDDLMRPHRIEQERPYEVVKTILLTKIDYENFTMDMLADRQFLEDYAALCSKGEMWKCLLIRKHGQTNGVLVMPESERYVGWAAYFGGCNVLPSPCTQRG